MKNSYMYVGVSPTVPMKFKGDISRLLSMMILPKKTIDAILDSAATDKIGDGKIFVIPLEE